MAGPYFGSFGARGRQPPRVSDLKIVGIPYGRIGIESRLSECLAIVGIFGLTILLHVLLSQLPGKAFIDRKAFDRGGV